MLGQDPALDPGPVMDRISNFRGIGGLATTDGRTTASGLLWRSGHLARATDDDLARLHALAVRTVVDLRTDDDIATDGPDLLPDEVVCRPIPIPDEAGVGADIRAKILRGDLGEMRSVWSNGRSMEIAVQGAVKMATNPSQVAAFSEVFSVIGESDNWPLVWHCSAGKDRAGWVGTALLLLLGVGRDAVVAHYLTSNRRTDERIAGLVASGRTDSSLVDLIRPFVEVSPEAVRAQMEAVDGHWGGAEAMFRDGFGFDDRRISELRCRLLD